MNTPAHLIFAAAAFARPDAPKRNAAVLAGALVPDLSLYVLAAWALFVMGQSPDHVFGVLYFSENWQQVFRIDNSFLIWGAALAVCWWRGWTAGVLFTLSALLHLALDFPLHHDDGRAHFWPLTTWVFQSPLSYWDPAHHGRLIGALEIALSLFFCGLLWRRFASPVMRAVISFAMLTQLLPGLVWFYVFLN